MGEAGVTYCRLWQDKNSYLKPLKDADTAHKRIRRAHGAWPGPLGDFGLPGYYFEHGQSWIGYDMIWYSVVPIVVDALQRSWSNTSTIPEAILDGDMYLFGVAQGESMKKMHTYF